MAKPTTLFGARTFTQKVMGEPISMGQDALGNPIVEMKIPGYDRMSFTPEGLEAMAEMLEAEPVAGDEPHQIAQRSASGYDSEGGLSFRLSEAARSRTLTLTRADRIEFAGLFRKILEHPTLVAALADGEDEIGEIED